MLGNCVRCKCIHIVYCIAEQRISISPPLLSHRTRKQQRPVGSRDDRDAMGGNRIATNHREKTMTWSILGVTIGFKRFKIMRSYARVSEERSGLFFRTAFFAALSLRASTSRFLPPVLQSTSSYVKNIHGYCSFSLAMSRYPTNHATKAF